jgi:tetratricopeptide (TPR) repeat protein
MVDNTHTITLPAFTPSLVSFRADEFLSLTETLLAFPIEQDQAALDVAPFRMARPEPRPEPPLPALPPRWYPRPAADVIEAARAWVTPPPRPTIFEGRTHELARVLRPLLAGHPVQVRGEAGVGKTTLLAVIASHERTRQRFRRIWWIDQPNRIDQTLALAFDLPHVLAEPDPVKRRERLAKQLDDHTLLIVDNLTLDNPLLEQLSVLTQNILAGVETLPVIPDPDNPLPEDPEGVVTLRGLDDTAAVDALARHAGIEDIRRIRAEMLRLATALGHHPYALMLAGALIRRDGLSLDELQNLIALEAEPESVPPDDPVADALAEDGETDRSAGPDAAGTMPTNPSLNRALDISLAALPRDYRRLFDAFGAFPPDGAPFDGLHTVSRIGDPLATRRGLLMLQEYGFIRRDHRHPDHYVMHPVAHLRAAAADSDHPAQSKIGKKVRDWALRYARAYRDDPLALYRAEPALLHAYQNVLDHGPQYVGDPLREALLPYLREYVPGLLSEGEAESIDLSGPRAEGNNLTRYGLQLTDEGAYFAAEEALIRALEIREEHDSQHAIAETLVALGRLYDMTGRTEEAAEKLIKAAELIYALGAEPSLSVVRRGLARVYRHLGRLNDALGVLDDAPEAHFERAMVLRAQGSYPAAVHEMSLSEENAPFTRAETFLLAGKYAEALEAIAGQDDPESNHLRAQVYHLQGHVDKAIQGYRAALDCCTEDDPARAKTLRGLGAALASDRQYDEAREALTSALAIYRAEATPDPLRLGRALRLLAAVHLAAGDAASAITTARDALVQLKKTSAPEDTADAYRTLGRALWRSEDYAGALEAFEGEAEFAQSMPERDDARIGSALHHVADAYRATGSLDRAIANYRLALTHKKPAADPTGYLITQLALHRVLTEATRLSGALDVSQEIIDHLTHQGRFDLVQYGYTQTLRARTQQAMQRPIRASQSLTEWTQVLAARADEAASDPRPALRVLVLGLAARSLLADDRPALALEVAEQGQATAVEHFPDTPAAWAACRDLGETYMALDRAEEAIITLEPLLSEALRDRPDQATTCALAHAITGRAYRQMGDLPAALEHLRTALTHEPDDHLKGLIHETIAEIHLDIGQPSEAVESLQAALPLFDREEHPDVVARVLTTLAHTLGGLNRYAEAINVYEDALAALRDVEGVSPTHTADVLRSLGRTHEAQGQLAEAARAYRRALNLLERGDAPRQALDILRLLARVTAALGDHSAVQLYEQARDETEKWGNAQELGEVLRELADVHRDAGRFPLAVQNYQAALSHQPRELFSRERAHTLRNLGRAYSLMERYDEARAAWTEALDLSHDLPDESPLEIGLTHHAIAEAYRSQTNYEDAEESYHEALRYLPAGTVASAASWRALGQTLQAAGRPADAIEALRKALDTEKTQPQQANARIIQTLYLLAEAYEDCSDLDAAIARYHEALVYMDRRLQPVSYADTLRILAGLYVEARNYPEAHVALQGALEIESQHVPRSDERISTTLQAIADTYRTAGDLEKAAEHYQKVTVYANLARRASEDLRETLDELERRRGTLQAAQQSLALLDRNPDADLKDRALILALIAHAYAGLNQAQESADTTRELLDMLAAQSDKLHADDAQGDYRAMAWLAAARQAEQESDPMGARAACESALEAAANANLHWVIEQVAQQMAEAQ